MPKDKESVNNEESLAQDDEQQDQEALSDQGNDRVLPDGRKLSNVLEENRRKGEENAKLKSQLKELQGIKQDRLDELNDKKRLTDSERKEIETLEDQIAAIKRDTRTLAWREMNKRDTVEETRKLLDTRDLEDALAYSEDLAEREKMTSEEFEKAIKPYLRQFINERPMVKLRKAYREYLKGAEERKELEELRELKKEKEARVQRDSGGRPRSESKAQTIEQAKKSGDWKTLLSQVAEVQGERTKIG